MILTFCGDSKLNPGSGRSFDLRNKSKVVKVESKPANFSPGLVLKWTQTADMSVCASLDEGFTFKIATLFCWCNTDK